jgi:hypothetical protein
MRHRMGTLVYRGFLLGVLVQGAPRAAGQTPSANEIVTRMMEHNAQRQAMLQHYASDRTYHLEYSGTAGDHHADMVVHADYTAPGHKHLTVTSESGSKVLCAEVLRKLVQGEEETAAGRDWQRAMFSPETYNLQLLGREQLGGVSTWVLRVEPKVASRVAYRGQIWVSTEDFATVRVLAEPAKNPSWLLTHSSFDARYMRLGAVWLPETNVSRTHVRIGGDATVTINYGNYQTLSVIPENLSLSSGLALLRPSGPVGNAPKKINARNPQ